MSKYKYVGMPIKELDDKVYRTRFGFEIDRLLGLSGIFLGALFPVEIVGNLVLSGAIVKMLFRMVTIRTLFKDNFAYKSSKEYIELESSYNKVIEDLASLFVELGVEGSIEIATIYSHMLNGGYLSKNNRFEYLKAPVCCSGLWGANVVAGEANDVNISCMLSDLLSRQGYNSNVSLMLLDCDVDSVAESVYEKLPEWMKNPKYKDIISKVIHVVAQSISLRVQDKQGEKFDENRVVTTVRDNDFSFVTNGFNGSVFGVSSDLTVPMYGHDYALYGHWRLNDGKLLKAVEMVEAPKIELLDGSIIASRQQGAKELCSSCEDGFHEFYREHAELYELLDARLRELSSSCTKTRNFHSRVYQKTRK